jgi:hypothetical protein
MELVPLTLFLMSVFLIFLFTGRKKSSRPLPPYPHPTLVDDWEDAGRNSYKLARELSLFDDESLRDLFIKGFPAIELKSRLGKDAFRRHILSNLDKTVWVHRQYQVSELRSDQEQNSIEWWYRPGARQVLAHPEWDAAFKKIEKKELMANINAMQKTS